MRNSFKKLLAAAIATLTLSVGFSKAQELRTITGVVLDETDLGIPGAYVVVKNQTRGSITDVEGKFTLEVKKGDILQVTFLGYQDEEISVGDQKHIIIKMSPSSDMLDEVTFVAYGSQRKASVIGSISTIKADALASPAGQLSSGLAGKLAGIVSLQRTGEPGAGSDFWIRGVNTFGANAKPLILVDGIERDMDLVDTEDIASFSILKDATATALYGVRGANGIVLITTKRGQESKPQVNFKAEYGLTQPVKLPSLANTEQWIDYYNELYVDAGSKPVIDEYQREMYLSGADPDLYPSVDWVSTVFKNLANTERVNVNVTGGTKGVRYYVGASYYMEDGIFNVVKDDDYAQYDNQIRYDKFNFRSNVDIDITKSTTLALSLSTQYYTKTTPGHSLADIYAYTMYATPISSPPVFSDGTLANPENGYNPYTMINSSGYKRTTNIVAQSLISLTQDFSDIITKGLKANAKFSWDADNGNVLGRLLNPTLYFTNGRDEDGNIIYEPWNEGTNYMYLSRT
ncbi:MAG: SusC/RagA family TonB-linked outer membrane protein, partial [Candidatus Cryptobacteroides sp.]